jgi:hypothetical protein
MPAWWQNWWIMTAKTCTFIYALEVDMLTKVGNGVGDRIDNGINDCYNIKSLNVLDVPL